MSLQSILNQQFDAESLPQLVELDLTGQNLDDLTGLKICSQLKVLKLTKNTMITSAQLTDNLPQSIEQLYLQSTGIQNSEFLKVVPNLEYLDVSNTPLTEVNNIQPKLKQLHALDSKINNIDFAKAFNNGIASYLSLSLSGEIQWSKLDFVTTLHIKGNYVKVDGFSKACKLQCIKLESNSINSLKALCKLQSLQECHLLKCQGAKLDELIDSSIQKLVLSGDLTYSLSGLEKMTKVIDLEIDMKFKECELPALDQLQRIVLKGSTEQPISGSQFSGERLVEAIFSVKIQNFHFDNMRNLEKLTLDNCFEQLNVNELSQMFKLQQLLVRNVKISTVEGIETCAALAILELTNVGDLDDLSQLEDLPSLQQLFVRQNKNLDSFQPSTNFKSLVLFNDNVFDRDALILDARQRKRWSKWLISHNDLRNENEIQYMEKLDLQHMQMKDCNLVHCAYKVKQMIIDGNISFKGFEVFELLQELTIQNSTVQNLQFLARNKNIENLVIKNCSELNDIQTIVQLKIKNLVIYNNPNVTYNNDLFKSIGQNLVSLTIDGIVEQNCSVLALCSAIKDLTIFSDTLDNLDFLAPICKNIKNFTVSAPLFTNPGVFYQMTELTGLFLPQCGITDFEFIVDLSTLKQFSSQALQTDLKPFGSSEKLEVLELVVSPDCDFSRLSSLHSLTQLSLRVQLEENQIQPQLQLDFLSEFTNLSSLSLANCDVGRCLEKLQFLSELSIDNVKLENIEILKIFVNLKKLKILNITLPDQLSFFAMINRLQCLEIRFCNLTEKIFQFMVEMKRLQSIDFRDNVLRHVDISDLPELQSILLQNNEIGSVKLCQMPLLKLLDLTNNKLNIERELTFEEQLELLQQAQGANQVKGIQKLAFVLECPKLKEFYFGQNNLESDEIKLQLVRIGTQIMKYHFEVTNKMYEQADAQEFTLQKNGEVVKYINLYNVGQDKDNKQIVPTKFDKVKYGAIDGTQGAILVNAMCLISGSSNFNELQKLSVKGFGIFDIQVLDKCFGLKDLDISENPAIKNFSVLKQLLNLERLILDKTSVSTLTFTKQMSRLITLSAQFCPNLISLAILSQSKNLKELDVFGSPCDIKTLPYNQLNLNFLGISGFQIKFIDLLAERLFSMLQQLKIELLDFVNADCLKQLAGLQSLELHSQTLTNLTSIKVMKDLQVLKVFCPKVSDLEPTIKQIPSIMDLSINDYILRECNFMNPLLKLEKLSITIDGGTNVNSLAKFTKLQYLNMYCCNAQVKFEVLQKLSQIRCFIVESCQNTDFTFIGNFKVLEILHIKTVPEIMNLKFLQYLVGIKECHFENTNLVEPDGLSFLIQCQDLKIKKCSLSHIDPIKKLRNLIKLDISNNSVTSLSALEGHNKLQYLYAQNNEITRVDPLLATRELLHVDLEGNLIRGSINDYVEEEHMFLSELFILVNHEKLISVNFQQNGLTGSSASRYAILRLLKNLAFISGDDANCRQVSYMDTKLAEQIQFYVKKGKDIIQFGYEMVPDRFKMLQMDESRQPNYIDKCERGQIALPFNNRIFNFLLRKLTKENISEIDDLDLSNTCFQSYEFIKEFNSLRFLKLQNVIAIQDFSFIQKFENLEIIHLSGTSFEDISIFQKFNRLRELFINDTQVKSINSLSSIKSLRILNIMGLALDPTTFKPFPQLDTLYVDCFDKKNGDCIKVFSNITELSIVYNESNTDFVQALTKLGKLSISSKELKSIQQIAKIKTITSLTLNCPALTDLPQVKQIPELKTLIVQQPYLRELLFIRDVKSLERLDITLREQMDVEVLSQLEKLRSLKLNCVKNAELKIEAFAIPDKLNQLSELVIKNFYVCEPKKIGVFRQLETLVLENNNQDFLDIDFLKSLVKIRVLKIIGSKIQDLHAFQSCNNIEDLTLENVGLPECNDVALNTKLQFLNLSNNNLIDISSLFKLTQLRKLNLDNNQLQDDCMQYIANLKSLNYLSIAGNQLGGVMEGADERTRGVISQAELDCTIVIQQLKLLEQLDISQNKICDAINYQEKILRMNPDIMYLNKQLVQELVLDKAENMDFKLFDYPNRDYYHFMPNFDVKQKISEQVYFEKLKRARQLKYQMRIDHPKVVFPSYNEIKFQQKKDQLQQLAQILSPIGAMKSQTTLFVQQEFKPKVVEEEVEDTVIYGDFENMLLLKTQTKSLNEIQYLDLSNLHLSSLEKIIQCQNLVELNLSGNDFTDISLLPQLQKLTSIDLSDNKKLQSISDLQKFRPGQIKKLCLNKTYVQVTLGDVQSLKQLKHLEIIDCVGFETKLLRELKDLEILCISGLNDDILLETFKPLSQIHELSIVSNIQNFQFLTFMSKLQKFVLNSSVVQEITFNPALEATQKCQIKHVEIDCESATKIEFKQAQISSLIIKNSMLSSLASIMTYKNLEYLVLNLKNIIELDPLAQLKQLTRLEIDGKKLVNINQNVKMSLSGLSKSMSIRELTVSNCPLEDISSVFQTSLRQIESLFLIGNRIQLTSVKFLKECTKLKRLGISNQGSITLNDITALQHLSLLEELLLSNNQFQKIDVLANTPNLKILNLSNVKDLSDFQNVSFFEALPHLESLNLSGTKISNFEFCQKLPNLSELYVDTCPNFQAESIDIFLPLLNCQQLRKISFLDTTLVELPDVRHVLMRLIPTLNYINQFVDDNDIHLASLLSFTIGQEENAVAYEPTFVQQDEVVVEQVVTEKAQVMVQLNPWQQASGKYEKLSVIPKIKPWQPQRSELHIFKKDK